MHGTSTKSELLRLLLEFFCPETVCSQWSYAIPSLAPHQPLARTWELLHLEQDGGLQKKMRFQWPAVFVKIILCKAHDHVPLITNAVKIEVLVVENYPKRRNIKKHYQNRTRSPWHGTRICFPSCAKTIHWHLWRVTPQGEWESMKVEDVITSCKHASSVCRITDAQMPGAPPWQLQRKPKRRHSAQKTT